MMITTPSVESLTRPRLVVAVVSAAAAVSFAYYAYLTASSRSDTTTAPGIHRSNAVRRLRPTRRRDSNSTSSTSAAGDENADIHNVRPLGDGEGLPAEESADDWWDEPGLPSNQRAGHNIVNLLFRVSEDNARRNGCVHRGCQCNSCGMVPIRGVRYRCANCADFDLCETCESQGMHTKTHIFYKIRVPAPPFGPRQMQPVWYTGDPDTCRRNLPKNLITKLTQETGFERPELEAFWEQWTFMANTEWREDPDELFLAMDRKTFERCLVPTGGSRHAAPNLIHDRMFAFYDWNKDGYIGFSEFLLGLSYRKRKDKLRKVFEGYDIDGDGYVNRKDFLRMFRAYYVLYKQMHKDILDGLEDQLLASTEAQQLVASRQPLSSLFGREGRVPHGEEGMRFEGKTIHRDGSIDIAEGYRDVVVPDREDTASRTEILTSLFACDGNWCFRWQPAGRETASEDGGHDRETRTLRVSQGDRPYLVTLIEPPTSLDGLPDLVTADNTLAVEEDDNEDDSPDEEAAMAEAESRRHLFEAPPFNEIEELIKAQNYTRRRISRLEKRRRDMARARLHDRWRRREFYLDEEEGGTAPEGWGFDDLDSQMPNGTAKEDRSAQQNEPSASGFRHRSSSERQGIPAIEKDAGKEILYQVTQQAFNELLDVIFKPSEDLYMETRRTKKTRDKYKDLIDAYEMPADGRQPDPPAPPHDEVDDSDSDAQSTKDKSLEELLSETGYEIVEENSAGPSTTAANGDSGPADNASEKESEAGEVYWQSYYETRDRKDPTLPQFRPDYMTWEEVFESRLVTYPKTRPSPSEASTVYDPTDHVLWSWKRLGFAEEQAAARGGWGKLSFDEFENVFRNQEFRGNRLDYLGSWIDFCIP